jgi:hypothetical protein
MREAYVCQNCRFTNVLDPTENVRRAKKRHPLWVDDFTWLKFKTLAAEFGSMGAFLNILLASYNPDKLYEVKSFG